MSLTFAKATRSAQKLKLAVIGPSGSGKTYGALALARHLAGTGKLAVIDTENGSASLYADRFDFDTLQIGPPYLTAKYREALDAAVEAGYEVVVIDSLSHQWDGDGGILQRKEQADTKPGSNQWTNWAPFTKEFNGFRAALLQAPVHIVATMRSKMAYTQSESGGRKKIDKLGMQPIQREGLEYEFTVSFDVGMDHLAEASKDRTSLFVGQRTDLAKPDTAKALLGWLASAVPLPPQVTAEEARERINALLPSMPEDVQKKVTESLVGGANPVRVLARLTELSAAS